MLKVFIFLTAVFTVGALHAQVDELTFEENKAVLWYEGVEKEQIVTLGEHKQDQPIFLNRMTKLPEELSVPLNTL